MLTRAQIMGNGSAGEVLHIIRTNKGWTMAELGRKCGLTQSAISKYEKDKRKPNIETYFKLLDAMGADLYIMHD